MEATERFAEMVGRPEPEIALDEAALLIAAHAYPALDIGQQLDRLDDLADQADGTGLDGLVRSLFGTQGFTGNTQDYYDPRNSYLNDVLDRRVGIPISLAVLAMSVGERVGVTLAGIGMPGHFLLRSGDDQDR